MGTPAARWVLLATVLGSGVAFLDGTIVNVALPAIAEDLDASLGDLQWVLERLPRHAQRLRAARRLARRPLRPPAGVPRSAWRLHRRPRCCAAWRPTSGCSSPPGPCRASAPRCSCPGSLAIISAASTPTTGPRRSGAWSGLGGVAGAIGPFVGGWLDRQRVVAAGLPHQPAPGPRRGRRQPPRARDAGRTARRTSTCPAPSPPRPGSALSTYGADRAAGRPSGVVGVVGARRCSWSSRPAAPAPMLPLALFRNRQFSGANLTTLAVYAALSGAFFLLVLQLQVALGYSALEAGVGPAAGHAAHARAVRRAPAPWPSGSAPPPDDGRPARAWPPACSCGPGSSRRDLRRAVLPGAIVFGLGLACTVAPLTATIMASADDGAPRRGVGRQQRHRPPRRAARRRGPPARGRARHRRAARRRSTRPSTRPWSIAPAWRCSAG